LTGSHQSEESRTETGNEYLRPRSGSVTFQTELQDAEMPQSRQLPTETLEIGIEIKIPKKE
jgi:hypothetical protein